jgi:hypothetical protein
MLLTPLIALIALHEAEAQEPERGETVTSRPRPELDPLGVRMGSFLFFPQLGVAARYDDNLYSTETDEIDDTITVVDPEIQLRSDWNNHALNFVAGAEAGYYSENDSEDYINYFAGADTSLDFTRSSRLEASAIYSILHEDRGSPEGENGIEPTEYSLLATGANYRHRFNRLSLGVGGRFDRYDYEDGLEADMMTVINNDDRNRDAWQGSLRLGYEVSPGFELFARGTYFAVSYDAEVDDSGFDRDSTGYEAVAGTAFDITGITFGELFAGYRSQEADGTAFEPMKGTQFGGSITWNPSGLTTIKGDVVRVVEETTQADSPGFFATRYGLGIDHELLRNLLLGLNGSYTTRKYEGIGRDDNYVRGGAYAKYLLNRHLYISLNYNYTDRRSSEAGEDFVKNVYMLRLQTQY